MNYLEFLYRALDAAYGISISTSDVERLRAKLYAARREAANPAFEDLSFRPSHALPTSELWIVKKTLPSQEPANAPA